MNSYNTNYLNNLYCNDDETVTNEQRNLIVPHYETPSTSNPYLIINQSTSLQNHNNNGTSQYSNFPINYQNQNEMTLLSSNIPTYVGTSNYMEVENSSNIICNLIPQQENYTTEVIDEIEAPPTPSTIFKCKEAGCGKVYTGISGLNGHIKKKHSGSALYPCDECEQTFSATHERTMHKIKEHEGRRYQAVKNPKQISTVTCNFPGCGKEFNKLTNLTRHAVQHETHKCKICEENFNHKTDLLRHMKSHNGTGHQCPECSKVFFTLEMFNEHRNLHDDSIPKHTCTECKKQFMTLRKLKEHSIIHQERTMWSCEVCSKVFVRSQTLQYHRITCKAEFACEDCVDSFVTEVALNKHKIFHTKEDFTCQKCNKAFSNQNALSTHEKRHSLRMNYTCQICKETVSTRAKFQKHIKDHLETNLRCSVCNEEFQSLVKYGYHKAEMHSIMRPYNCVLCTDEFCTRHELFMHLHNHIDPNTSSNTYTCEICSLKFSTKNLFEQHTNSHLKVSEEMYPMKITTTTKITEIEEEATTQLEQQPEEEILELVVETEKPKLPCNFCEKIFYFQSLLQHHISSEHDIKKYPCTIGFCDQIYTNSDDLEKHKKSHEDCTNLKRSNENLICKIDGCRREFQYQSRMKQHMASHVLKEYNCEKCQNIYYSEAIFNNHVIVCGRNSEIKDENLIEDENLNSGPVNCTFCNQLFENKLVLKNHRKFCPDPQEM